MPYIFFAGRRRSSSGYALRSDANVPDVFNGIDEESVRFINSFVSSVFSLFHLTISHPSSHFIT
jgi:hypothetical protein